MQIKIHLMTSGEVHCLKSKPPYLCICRFCCRKERYYDEILMSPGEVECISERPISPNPIICGFCGRPPRHYDGTIMTWGEAYCAKGHCAYNCDMVYCVNKQEIDKYCKHI